MNLYDLSFAATPTDRHWPSGSGGKPFPYQEAAMENIALRTHAYCAHHPGAGKTPMALAASMIYEIDEPVLVVCPPSIVYQWAKKAREWTGLPWFVCTSTRDVHQILGQPGSFMPARFIVSDSLIHEVPPERFELLIIDEAHRFKTRGTRRTRHLFGHADTVGVAQRAGRLLALSGTPMPNGPVEMYPWLHCASPEIAPTWAKYTSRYCPPESIWVSGREIVQHKTAANTEELKRLLRSTTMVRPKREDILGQLPPIRRDTYDITLRMKCDQSAEEMIHELTKKVDEQGKEQKAALATMRREVGIRKTQAALPWLQDLIDGGDAPLIWFWHRDAAGHAASALGCPLITGDKTPEQRRDALASFAAGAPAICMTIEAAGTGIDGFQHRTDLAVFIENSYVPHHAEQAEGRLQRIGQTRPVRVIRVMSDHPMDYAIEAIRSGKAATATEIIG